MSEFNFKSQPCTSREQSERLIALGLKKVLADMYWTKPFGDWIAIVREGNLDEDNIPAWSLDRLLEILPHRVYESLSAWDGREYDNILDLNLDFDFGLWYKGSERHRTFFDCNDLYDSAVQAIEWLIKEGYFNKDYLCSTSE